MPPVLPNGHFPDFHCLPELQPAPDPVLFLWKTALRTVPAALPHRNRSDSPAVLSGMKSCFRFPDRQSIPDLSILHLYCRNFRNNPDQPAVRSIHSLPGRKVKSQSRRHIPVHLVLLLLFHLNKCLPAPGLLILKGARLCESGWLFSLFVKLLILYNQLLWESLFII